MKRAAYYVFVFALLVVSFGVSGKAIYAQEPLMISSLNNRG